MTAQTISSTTSPMDALCFTSTRELSFGDSWPFKLGKRGVLCYPRRLAEAGFVYSGNGKVHSARCFVCFKELEGWEDTEDPWVEHKKRQNDCPWAANGKTEEEYTVRQMLTVMQFRQTKQLENEKTKALEELNDKFDEVKKTIEAAGRRK